jgi:hypothetical protein
VTPAAVRGPDVLAGRAGLPASALVVIAAFVAGAVAQGGYYWPGRLLVALLTSAAAVVGLRGSRPWSVLRPLLVSAAALAMWAVVRAGLDGGGDGLAGGLLVLLTIGGLVGAVLVVQRTDAAVRHHLARSVVAVGAAVALAGWAGVAGQWPRFAVIDGGLWRAGATITYPNALAALLTALALLALSMLLVRPTSIALATAAYLLVVGLGATMSRAGGLAFLAGLAVLTLLAGFRGTVRVAGPVVLGAIVAVSALVPSIPTTARAQSLVASCGLGIGLAITLGIPRLRAWMPLAVLPAVLTALLSACLVAGFTLPGQARGWTATSTSAIRAAVAVVAERRLTVSSSGRSGAWRAAEQLVSARPLVGWGPGHATLS